jgi:type III restriction enzyme
MDSQTTDYFKEINKLSVIASESYEEFSKQLQGEYKHESSNTDDEYDGGVEIINENKVTKFKAGLNSNSEDSRFVEFWNLISQKSIFQTDFDTNKIVEDSVEEINTSLDIPKVRVEETVGQINDLENADEVGAVENITTVTGITALDKKRDLIGAIVKETGLKRETIHKILTKISTTKFNMYKNNPDLFILRICKLINTTKIKVILKNSSYIITDKKIDIEVLKDYYSELQGQFNKNIFFLGDKTKHISDHIKVDSETEKEFFEQAERGLVDIYAKLPPEFKISTPVGYYNPDWAVLLKKDNFTKIYFIVETKGFKDKLEMSQKEILKTEYAKKHFNAIKIGDVGYKVVDSFETFMNQAAQ